mmetsp:Transcript_43140/g.58554  ORF Transcript_43140/g.58554 Transcript_43140/m.58554 type:complete len:93 (+) Transcript_43140:235-513(+)
MQVLSKILLANNWVLDSMVNKKHNILVHCSDGWDRTPQMGALAQICLDPFYRTISGFRVLVEKDWCSYGHMFHARCGHYSNDNLSNRAPVFV